MPGEHGSTFHPGSLSQSTSSDSTPSTGMKVVPFPLGSRTNRDDTFTFLCEPGRNDLYQCEQMWADDHATRQPFSGVQASSAIQAPIALGGFVYRNVESLWLGTGISFKARRHQHSPVPPILGCLQITILCNTLGSLCAPSCLATSLILPFSKVCFRKTGSRTPNAWPILLIDFAGGTRSFAGDSGVGAEMEDGSRK